MINDVHNCIVDSQNKLTIIFAWVIIMFIFALTILAGMVKLVDMPDLGSGAARRVGSSPITRTESPRLTLWTFFMPLAERKNCCAKIKFGCKN